MKVEVKFQVAYTTTIELPDTADDSDIQDAISDIDIPQSLTVLYVCNSFEVLAQEIIRDEPNSST